MWWGTYDCEFQIERARFIDRFILLEVNIIGYIDYILS
jgi:hypothetical protein